MVRLSIQQTATGWHVHAHPSDRFNLDQNHSFDHKREALQKTKNVLEEWILEVDDCQFIKAATGGS